MSRAHALAEKPRASRVSRFTPSSRSRRTPEAGRAPAIQVGRPDDRCEAEADRAADAVVRGEAHRTHAFSISTLPVRDAPGPSRPSPPAPRVVAAPGERLAPPIRSVMEARFGADFRDVRIHRDAGAARAARALGAEAWTIGRDVSFAAGRYRPESPDGSRLLAHELAHVVQQRSAAAGPSPLVQRKGGTFGGFFANIGRSIASIFVDEPGFSDTTLRKLPCRPRRRRHRRRLRQRRQGPHRRPAVEGRRHRLPALQGAEGASDPRDDVGLHGGRGRGGDPRPPDRLA